jgi:hypothetical protein
LSDPDAASIEAQIVEILGPQVGPVVAQEVIDHAIKGYAIYEPYVPQWDWATDQPLVPRTKRGRPKSSRRHYLGVHVALILRRASVPLPKAHTGRSQISRASDFAKVLSVVFKAVGEPVPADMFDIIEATLAEVELRQNMIGME